MDFNAPVEDYEVAEKDNFKSNSEWEGLAGKLEEVFLRTLSNQKLPIGKSPSVTEVQPWNKVGEEFQFGIWEFTLTRYWISGVSSASPEKDFDLEVVSSKREEGSNNNKQIGIDETPKVWVDSEDTSNYLCEPCTHHCDIRDFHLCYGLKDFIILSISHDSHEYVIRKGIIRILSETIGSHCQVPLFVQLDYRLISLAILEHSGLKTSLEMHYTLPYRGLHNLYKDFMIYLASLGTEIIPNTTRLSARFTYIVYERLCFPCKALPPNLTFSATDFGMKGFYHWDDDESRKFNLYLNWPNYEITAFEGDLDPNTATEWLLQAKFSDTSKVPLGRCLRKFLDMCYPTSSPSFKTPLIEEYVKEIDESLTRQYFGSKFRNDIFKLRKSEHSLILPESLDAILEFLFSHSSHSCVENSASTAGEVYNFFSFPSKEVSKYFVSAKDSDLMTRLAVCLCIVNKYHGGVRAVKQLWEEFILQVQYYKDITFAKKYRRNMGCLLPPWNLQILRLSLMDPSDLVFAFMPFLIKSAVTTLKNYSECKNSFLKEHLLRIEEKLEDIQCDKSEFKKCEDLVHYVTLIEQRLTTIQYILKRLRPYVLTLSDPQRISEEELQNFVSDLVENRMVLIKNHKENPFGMLIHNFFLENLKDVDYRGHNCYSGGEKFWKQMPPESEFEYSRNANDDSDVESSSIQETYSDVDCCDSDAETSWDQEPCGSEFKYSRDAYDDPDAETSIQEPCAVSEPTSRCYTHVLDEKVTWGQLDKFPMPWGREYIFTLKSKATDPSQQPYTQLLRCLYSDDGCRMAGAFTSDLTFGERYASVMNNDLLAD